MREVLPDNGVSVDDEDHPSTRVAIRSRNKGFNRLGRGGGNVSSR